MLINLKVIEIRGLIIFFLFPQTILCMFQFFSVQHWKAILTLQIGRDSLNVCASHLDTLHLIS